MIDHHLEYLDQNAYPEGDNDQDQHVQHEELPQVHDSQCHFITARRKALGTTHTDTHADHSVELPSFKLPVTESNMRASRSR